MRRIRTVGATAAGSLRVERTVGVFPLALALSSRDRALFRKQALRVLAAGGIIAPGSMLIPRHEFKAVYERIKDAAAEVKNGCSLLLFVAADVDAICAARILVVRLRAAPPAPAAPPSTPLARPPPPAPQPFHRS